MPLGPWELAIILIIVVIIFGVGKLPQIGGALGQGIREFRTGATGDESDNRGPLTAHSSTVEPSRSETLRSDKDRENR